MRPVYSSHCVISLLIACATFTLGGGSEGFDAALLEALLHAVSKIEKKEMKKRKQRFFSLTIFIIKRTISIIFPLLRVDFAHE
jgi:hypothetical protein